MAITIYDAVIVGTGATGGMAAKVLAERGMQTLLLESGPSISSADFLTHSMPYEFPFRGSGSPSKARRVGRRAASERTPFVGYHAENDQHPYSFPPLIFRDLLTIMIVVGVKKLLWEGVYGD